MQEGTSGGGVGEALDSQFKIEFTLIASMENTVGAFFPQFHHSPPPFFSILSRKYSYTYSSINIIVLKLPKP